MRFSALVAVAVAASVSVGQPDGKKTLAFKPADYPNSDFRVTQSSHALGAIEIRIIHAKKRKPNASPPSYCRAWAEISRGQTLLQRIYFGDIEPVGYSYGIFVPAKQPAPDYFALVKEGDYDGRLLLVNSDGCSF
jgi:hypothetical protein